MPLDHYTPEEERSCDLAADAIFELYREAAFRQTEAALETQRLITRGEARVPDAGEVRGWIAGVVRGALVVREPEPTRRQRFTNWWFK